MNDFRNVLYAIDLDDDAITISHPSEMPWNLQNDSIAGAITPRSEEMRRRRSSRTTGKFD